MIAEEQKQNLSANQIETNNPQQNSNPTPGSQPQPMALVCEGWDGFWAPRMTSRGAGSAADQREYVFTSRKLTLGNFGVFYFYFLVLFLML